MATPVLKFKNIVRKTLSYACRFYPFYSGCGAIANSPSFRWLVKDGEHGNSNVWTTVRNGYKILIPLNDHVGRSLFYFGELDPKITWVCKRLVQPGDLVVDIGANVGLVSLFLSKFVGDQGYVHAFEPQLNLVEMVQKSIDANQLNNITIHGIGLGSKKDHLELFIPDDNLGGASLVSKNNRRKCINVEIENTSDYFNKLKLKEIKLIKIDVEGFEDEVLAGLENFIQEVPPQSILFEVSNRSFEFSQQPVVKILNKHRYVFFNIEQRLMKMKLSEISGESSTKKYGNDIIAVHESYLSQAKKSLLIS